MKLLGKNKYGLAAGTLLLAFMTGTGWAAHTVHDIDGVTGPNFTFTAKSGYISTAEGNSVYFWGYGNGSGTAVVPQYCGPTMIVNQGVEVTVTLVNALPVNTSIVFPGQSGVTTQGGVAGRITQEAAPGGSVTYKFTPSRPGTYLYESGTQPDLQTEMGLVGALIVGMVDTLGRAFLKPLLGHFISPPAAEAAGPALASMLIYLLMAVVLAVRPAGLFPAKS